MVDNNIGDRVTTPTVTIPTVTLRQATVRVRFELGLELVRVLMHFRRADVQSSMEIGQGVLEGEGKT